ncbi:DUF6795 domain-containing protein [Shewanella sp. OMA3-2]|uniref:DUF6795 domain-containing protein n=1 Tax=Shewanella sp. OMA3-2 TaxID=2908650 RepID=UPI001F1D5FC9|nr:DUF6795 domain-containing protein [Shewanella sp. OMA3-2]UJF20981.1 hypothetical protein L0B17_12525 [Shewanella sp. OMA3-2]
MFGFFKKYDAHLCSAVSGRILDNGKPLVGVKIERELRYIDNKKRIDSTLTDKNGCFTMPVVNIRSKAPGWLFCEQMTGQTIGFFYKSEFYKLWGTFLSGTESIAAYDEKLSQLNADIVNPNVFFTFENKEVSHVPYGASSICRWDTDFEIQQIIED